MRFNTCPGADTLRRAQPWQTRPKLPDPLRQTAVHEARHIVLIQRVALHVLQARWADVEVVAAEMLSCCAVAAGGPDS